jgi:hypothetical protein
MLLQKQHKHDKSFDTQKKKIIDLMKDDGLTPLQIMCGWC